MSKRSRFRTRSQKTSEYTVEITTNLDENLQSVKKMLGDPDDLVIREIPVGKTQIKCAVVFISGLVDQDLVENNIIKPIQYNRKTFEMGLLESVNQEVIPLSDVQQVKALDDVSYGILQGNTAVYIDDFDQVLVIGTAGGKSRQIEEPPSERLVRGPRAGFVEQIQTNMSLLRQDLKDPNLRFETHEVGRRTKQKLVVTYMEGIVNPDLIKEINHRLKTIDTDKSLDSGQVEQWIEDSFLSPFPQLMDTERPDRVSSALMQGKFAILVDGTPFVLIAPVTLVDSLQSLEDYNQRWLTSSLFRILRFISAFIAMFLPALYIALVSYHPDLLPTQLVISIAASREGVPFPAVIEAVAMAITFEILHEAGIRLPKLIGSTIGIVGGLVIGESAVSAGIVSPIMVIITALTAIASFTTPQYSVAIAFRAMRFGFMIAAAIFGLYGIILIYIMVNIHLVNLKSIGIPYSTPFAPSFIKDWKDLVFRAPLLMLTGRPKYLMTQDKKSSNKGRSRT
ncbi:spore germination protein [Oceanobacillus limi]|uniref:Spore germination protein n=1 Tax=Oceanobacillus limi TaxID=930131 RepID=A0A1I0CD82_9BACI|nr:spore germination protein [Oceanobacillus limi]SET16971.1 spore germination protein [Oceanobacillus limi]